MNVDICCNARLTHSGVHIICDNADRIKESAKSAIEVFVYCDYHSPVGMNCTKKLWMCPMFLLH
jgi:hypothetical protein